MAQLTCDLFRETVICRISTEDASICQAGDVGTPDRCAFRQSSLEEITPELNVKRQVTMN